MPKVDHRTSEARAANAELGGAREQLLDAAARVFSRRGYEKSSINEIVSEAGFSKGALYWHFAGKEDLFFALLDERIDTRIRDFFMLLENSPAEAATARTASLSFDEILDEQRELVLLFHELSNMAARDPRLRERYIHRNTRLREGLAKGIEARHATLGVPLAIPADDLASILVALTIGVSIDRLADPEGVAPGLLGEAFSLIYDGLLARARGVA